MFGKWEDRPGYTVERGAVSDWCPDCDAVRLFLVEDRMEELHFIIWRQSTSRSARRVICSRCDYWKYLSGFGKGYAEWVPVARAERMPLRELLELTNPDLYDDLYRD